MPKAAGSEMKTTRLAPRQQPKARPIKRFDPPDGPKVDPMSMDAAKQADRLTSAGKPPQGGSNKIAAKAVRIASTPGKINPKQQHY